MNFFKSILSEDPDPPAPEETNDSGPDSPRNASDERDADEDSGAKPVPSAAGSGWSFGGLMQTIATRSESVIETYRRDLEEFGSGLRKETEIFRDVASRAVKELPASIEVGASKAQGSFESVIKSTAEIISQGIESTAGSISESESDNPESNRRVSSARYSRFDAQLSAIQIDEATFCEEPEDLDDFRNWKLGFVFEEKEDEMLDLIGEDGALEGVHSKVVPSLVDDETFWYRYFYRVHKLKQQESVRANLVKRAISADDEEELSWDVDDEDEDEEVQPKGSLPPESSTSDDPQSSAVANDNPTIDDDEETEREKVEENEKRASVNAAEVDQGESGDAVKAASVDAVKIDHGESAKDNEKAVPVDAVKDDNGESVKDGDASSQHEDQDLEWDEIGDVGSGDEKKPSPIARGASPNSADLKKRLSTATAEEDDEELSWDIEDED